MLLRFKSFTSIYHLDEHRAHLEMLQVEFHDESKYSLKHYYSEKELLIGLEEKPPRNKDFNILIYGGYYNGNQEKKIDLIKAFIKTVEEKFPSLEIIVILPSFDQKIENELLSLGAYAVIQRNENTFLRITNHVRGIISKKAFEREKLYTKITVRLFFASIVIFLLIYALLRLISTDPVPA